MGIAHSIHKVRTSPVRTTSSKSRARSTSPKRKTKTSPKRRARSTSPKRKSPIKRRVGRPSKGHGKRGPDKK